MKIKFLIEKQSLYRVDNQDIVSDSKNYLYASFTFSDDWDGVNKVAQFTKDDITYNVDITDGQCLVPWEVLQGEGTFYVNVFGGDLITVNECAVYVLKSGLREGQLPSEPTPGYFDEVINTTKGYKDEAEGFAEDSKNSAEEAKTAKQTAIEKAAEALQSAANALASEENAHTSAEDAEAFKDEIQQKLDSGEFKGEDGREVILQKSATHIQWAYVGEPWENLAALADLTGDDGKEIELRKTATHVQWRHTEGEWENLIALEDIKGVDGYTPIKGVDYFDGSDASVTSENIASALGYTPLSSSHNTDDTAHQDIRAQIYYVPDIKPARIVVGTSTSGWTERDCHYLCDGVADDVVINTALSDLPAAGGEIIILDGTYNITDEIIMDKANTSTRGNGNATILKRMFDNSSAGGVIRVIADGCKVRHLKVDGNRDEYDNTRNSGIYLRDASYVTISDNTCVNNRQNGIYVNADNPIVLNNICSDNGNRGIYASGDNGMLSGNTCANNALGISLNNSVSGIVSKNNCNGNSQIGIEVGNSYGAIVKGNSCNYGTAGIELINGASDNVVSINTCIECNVSSIAARSDAYGNLVSSNICGGKSPLDQGDGNVFVNNL